MSCACTATDQRSSRKIIPRASARSDAPIFPTRFAPSPPRPRRRGCGPSVLPAGGAGRPQLQHVRGPRGDVAAPHGTLQPGLRRVRPLSTARDLGGEQGADREIRRPHHSGRGEDVLRHHRAVGRLRSCGGHPDPRGEARRPLGAERAQGIHLARQTHAVGHVFARTDKGRGASIPASSSRRERRGSPPPPSAPSAPQLFPTTWSSRTARFPRRT